MSAQFIPLEQACDFLSGYAWSAADFQSDPMGLPIIRIQNVDAVRESDFVYWDGPFDERFVVRNGDLLLTLSGSFRVVVWDGPEALLNQRIVKLMPKDGYTRDWLLYVLRNALNAISGMGRHALVSNVALADLRSLKIPRQTIEEQRRIAAILDQAETLRTQRRTALALLDSLTQSLFLDMFGDPVANPKGWPIQTLDEVTTKVTDGEHLNPAFTEVGMPIVMAGNVLDDRIDLDAAKRVGEPLGMQFRKKCGPELGDLLIVGRGATIGRLCRVNVEETFCLMGSVILVKPDRTLLDERFLSGMLALPSMHAQLYKSSGSSAQQAIYLKDVKRLKCPLPPLPLQQTFATRIASIEALKATHRRALAALDALFASLQQRAFTGAL